MYRGTKVIRSWTMAGLLTVASGVGIVAVSHSLQTPLAATAAPAVASTSASLVSYSSPVGGDDRYGQPLAGATATTTATTTHRFD